jgi:Family of unknown function (DUF5681)
MTTNPPDDGDDVGHGRPPMKTRWKKGQSGNPRGAPKRRETALEMIDRLLLSLVTATVNGETKRITALEAIVLQLQIQEIAGNSRASRILLAYREFASQTGKKEVRLIFINDGDDDGAGGGQA